MPIAVFSAGGTRIRAVRFVLILSIFCAVASLWWGTDILLRYGMAQADGGILAPLAVRILLAGCVFLAGFGFACGMWLYCGIYVVEISIDEKTSLVTIKTLAPAGRKTFGIEQVAITKSRPHEGSLRTSRQTVNAPWISIHVDERKLPLIIDLRGRILDEKIFRKVLRIPSGQSFFAAPQ